MFEYRVPGVFKKPVMINELRLWIIGIARKDVVIPTVNRQ